MTTAPPGLTATRRLLLDHLDMHPGAVSGDLDPAEVGIVGDTAHVSEGDSYHLGRPEQDPNGSYSVTRSPRDRAGLCEFASALDVGQWSARVAGKTHGLPSMSVWLVHQCEAGTADTADIREIIYSPDGKVVRRWDRLKRSTTGDDSHLFHTHVSVFRDATRAGRGLVPLMTRYLQSIGLIEGDDMDQHEKLAYATDQAGRTVGQVLADLANFRNWLASTPDHKGVGDLGPSSRGALLVAAAQRQPQPLTDADRADIAARLLAGLPADLADRIADTIAARLQA